LLNTLRYTVSCLSSAATKATRLACLGTIVCCIAMPSVSAAQPNIVFIMADDLGAGEIQWDPTNSNIAQQAADANAPISTPSLYSMAQEGVRFTNYLSAAPVCSPARAAILTGLYPAEFGIRAALDNPSGRGIPQGTPTIASLLKEQGGYRTAHFGKWHL
jgi:arylsulfatase A